MKKNPILIVVLVAIIVGALAFYGGMMVTGSSSSGNGERRNFNPNFNGSGFGRNGGQNGGFVNGTVLKMDNTSITVQSRDGTSRIVFLSDMTKIQKSVEGTVSDLSIGKQVRVTGKQGSDGTVAADNVQILPAMPVNPNGNPSPNSNVTPPASATSNTNS